MKYIIKKYTYRERLRAAHKYFNFLQALAYIQNIPFQISRKWFIKWYMNTPNNCYYCNINKYDYNRVRVNALNNNDPLYSQFLWVIENDCFPVTLKMQSFGYDKLNIVKSCWHCNRVQARKAMTTNINPVLPRVRSNYITQ